MLQFKIQTRRRSVIALTLALALCAASIIPAAATTQTSTSLPVVTSVQLNLPGAGANGGIEKIRIRTEIVGCIVMSAGHSSPENV